MEQEIHFSIYYFSEPLTTSADNTEVEASMNDLAFLETSESFTVTATPTNPQPGTLLTITFNSERGILIYKC